MFRWYRFGLLWFLSMLLLTSPVFAQDSAWVQCITRNFHNWVSPIQGMKRTPNRMYLAVGHSGLRIVNIATLQQPTELGSCSTIGFIKAVDASDTLAYVIQEHGGLHILNVSNPAQPYPMGYLAIPGDPSHVVVRDRIAYVSSGSMGLVIVDVSNPSTPSLIGTLDTPGSAKSVALKDSTAYIADSSSIRIVNIATPIIPSEIDTISQPAQRIAIDNDRLYVPNTSGMYIYSIAGIDTVALLGTLPAPASGGWWYIAISEERAYLTNSAGLTIVNVTTPASPAILYLYTAAQNSTELEVANHIAFLSCNGLRITDVTSPTSPQTYTTFNLGGYDYQIARANGYVYVANRSGGMLLFSNDLQTILGRSNAPTDARQIVVNGNYAYVQSSNSGIHVMNCTNPAQPSTAMIYTEGNRLIKDIALSGTRLYFAIDNGLRIIDVSSPGSPTYAGAYRLTTPGTAVVVVGMTAYLGLQSGAVHIVNVTNAMSPTLLGSYQGAPTSILDVQCTGNDLYVLNGANSLRVISIVNPSQPQLQAQFDSLSGASKFSIHGNYILVAEGQQGVRVLSRVSETEIRAVGFYNTAGTAFDVSVDTMRVYVADSTSIGLYDYSPVSAITEKPSRWLPEQIQIVQASPNPFNSSIRIEWELPVIQLVSVQITDVLGRKIVSLFDGVAQSGTHRITWNGNDDTRHQVSSGVYFVTIRAGTMQSSRKIVLLR